MKSDADAPRERAASVARIRTIKPEFFSSQSLAECSTRARLTFVALWCFGDDEGRHRDDARIIKAEAWPLDDDVTALDVEGYLFELARAGLIERYEACSKHFLAVKGWREHQRIDRRTPSQIPAPDDPSSSPRRALDEGSLQEGKGKERKGSEEVSSVPTEQTRAVQAAPEPAPLAGQPSAKARKKREAPLVSEADVQSVWARHLKARRNYFRFKNGVEPARLPDFTPELALEIREAIRRHGVEKATAAGVGIFYSDFHTGKNTDEREYLEADLCWRINRKSNNVERFAALYEEKQQLRQIARGIADGPPIQPAD